MTVTTIAVPDMHCAACVAKVRRAVNKLVDVAEVQFNPVKRQVFVSHGSGISNAELLREIETAGFQPQLIADSGAGLGDDGRLLKRLGVAGIGMMQVMMVQIALYAGFFQGMEQSIERLLELTALLFCIPVVAYSAVPFFVRAAFSLRHGLNMDTPIGLAIAVAFTVSLTNTLRGSGDVYYDSVVMFTFLMLGARFWEQRLRHRLAMQDSLQASLPRFATRIQGSQHISTPIDAIQPQHELWIVEGEQIPLDGTLISDHATLEQAWLTGESDWRDIRRGEPVFAGTYNRGAGLRMCVTSTPQSTRVAHIDAMADQALDQKSRFSRLADRVAGVFIPAILSIAGMTYITWSLIDPDRALSAALAVLVVSCPCALSLATPAAITAALTRLRNHGVLVRNSAALERISGIARVFFDKTGTLTSPNPQVVDAHIKPGWDEKQCWRYACALQAHSSHPLARAFHTEQPLAASEVVIHTGAGVAGRVDGSKVRIGTAAFCGQHEEKTAPGKEVHLAIDGESAAVYTLASPLRQDAEETIRALQADGLQVSMLSGDTDANCAAVADTLGIAYAAAATPESKPGVVCADAHNEGTLYVGDGINDLPALARATVSAATVETADLVKARADVLLLSSRLKGLAELIRTGRRCRGVMRQNLGWALAYNLAAIPLAALGLVPPWAAALGMSASSLLVMLNSTRLLANPAGGDS